MANATVAKIEETQKYSPRLLMEAEDGFRESSPYERAVARLTGIQTQLAFLSVVKESGEEVALTARAESELLYGLQTSLDDVKRDLYLAAFGKQ